MGMMKKIYFGLLALWLCYHVASERCLVTKKSENQRREKCDRYYGCRMEYEHIDVAKYYTCVNTSITDIQQQIEDRNVNSYINITNSSIPVLEPDNYQWGNVQELWIHETNTSEIIPGFFNKLGNLKTLQITKNKITQIVTGLLSPLSVLEVLNLTDNRIETVATHSFSGMLNLRVLDLSKNKITSMPQDVFEYQNFLHFIDLSDNNLKNVSDYLFNQPSLQTLNLAHNFLVEFDFNQLRNVSKINLSNNLIEKYLIADANIINFEEVLLSHNKITTLQKIRNVKSLNISYNKIQNIDEHVLSESLETLDISNNNITNGLFNSLKNLKYLYLDHNYINSLSIDALYNLQQLLYLDLSFNRIKQIPFGFFNDLTSLVFLDLSNNNMILDFHVLLTLKSLTTLKFSNNKVQNFDASTLLVRFKNLESITLSDGSWSCSELALTIHQLQMNNINFTHGQDTNISNILGVSCKENTDIKEESIVIERVNDAPSEKIDDSKYLQIISKYIFENASLPILNATIDQNNNLLEYMNKSFTDYLKNFNTYAINSSNSLIEAQKYIINEMFNSTNFNTYINSVVNNSTKKEYIYIDRAQNKSDSNDSWLRTLNSTLSNLTINLRNLTSSIINISNDRNQVVNDKSEANALITEKNVDNSALENSLIVINILLAVIMICLILLAYHNFCKPKLNRALSEQVQLM
ncbi:unnamed protein product [Ceutorhynchus assimilis]|uniref:Uncharacterized protein n=1 Tax=Ceutorhynchus assimilis TaxID=467358 RepID=A0A9P0GT27_9CUCU|nr:unnamed protein product [Ceutorhynchus assimilis]